MKVLLCAIYDVPSDRYMPLFCQQAKGQAIRTFSDEVNRMAEDNILYKHPDDFILFQLGEFDDVTGDISVLGSEEKLISGREAKNVVSDRADQPRLKGVN